MSPTSWLMATGDGAGTGGGGLGGSGTAEREGEGGQRVATAGSALRPCSVARAASRVRLRAAPGGAHSSWPMASTAMMPGTTGQLLRSSTTDEESSCSGVAESSARVEDGLAPASRSAHCSGRRRAAHLAACAGVARDGARGGVNRADLAGAQAAGRAIAVRQQLSKANPSAASPCRQPSGMRKLGKCVHGAKA
jgi:hypothetical protein